MSEFFEQIPFSNTDFAENPEPRCACILLLDTSGSMNGRPIKDLNTGLVTLKDELVADSMAVKRVELAIVSFGPVKIEAEFQTADVFTPPTLEANGETPMGEAIETAVEMLKQRKEIYKQNGIMYYRPWIFLITDGAPTDNWKRAASLIREGEEMRSFMFFAVGVEDANMDILKQISKRDPLKLKGLRFRDMFLWLSNSLGARSRSGLDDKVILENPTVPEGWAIAE